MDVFLEPAGTPTPLAHLALSVAFGRLRGSTHNFINLFFTVHVHAIFFSHFLKNYFPHFVLDCRTSMAPDREDQSTRWGWNGEEGLLPMKISMNHCSVYNRTKVTTPLPHPPLFPQPRNACMFSLNHPWKSQCHRKSRRQKTRWMTDSENWRHWKDPETWAGHSVTCRVFHHPAVLPLPSSSKEHSTKVGPT